MEFLFRNLKFVFTSLLINLTNDRVFIISLDMFPLIKIFSMKKKSFEIIDDRYLSFLSMDDIISLEELIGLSQED